MSVARRTRMRRIKACALQLLDAACLYALRLIARAVVRMCYLVPI